MQFCVIFGTLFVCHGRKKIFSRRHVVNISLCSLLVVFFVLYEGLFYGVIDLFFILDLYAIVLASMVMVEYSKKNHIVDAFFCIFVVVSIVSLVVILKLFVDYGFALIGFLSLSDVKRLTHLWFVNSFAYSCAFGILCGCVSWSRGAMVQKHDMRWKCIYFVTLVFPLMYLLLSKSKGGLALTFIGAAMLYLRARAFIALAGIAAVMSLFYHDFLVDTFVKMMMLGRTAPQGEMVNKAFSMVTSRFGASYFRQSPIDFLINHPFGVGTSMAWAATYAVPGKDVVIKNHSLLLILIDSCGVPAVLSILFVVVRGFCTIRPRLYFLLGLSMLAIPVTVVNEPSLAYAIPLVIIMSRQTFVNYGFSKRWT